MTENPNRRAVIAAGVAGAAVLGQAQSAHAAPPPPDLPPVRLGDYIDIGITYMIPDSIHQGVIPVSAIREIRPQAVIPPPIIVPAGVGSLCAQEGSSTLVRSSRP